LKEESALFKKEFTVSLALIIAFILTSSTAFASGSSADPVKAEIKVLVDGNNLESSQGNYLANGTLLVPYRALAEKLGGEVGWNPTTKKVTVKKDANVIEFAAGQNKISVNGVETKLDIPVQIINGTTYGPVRLLGQLFGFTVGYDGTKKAVSLQTSQNPDVDVFGVSEGDMLYADQLEVAVIPVNHELKDFRSHKEAKAGEGHVHIWLDTDVSNPVIAHKLTDSSPVVFDNVKPGKHTLTVQLVGNDHKPVQPEVKRVIHFTTADAPSVSIQSPKAGATVIGDKVTVELDVMNHQLVDFRKHSQPKEGQGHVHVWLDTDASDPKAAYKLVEGNTVTFDQVAPGQHTLTVQLVGNDHKPVNPQAKQVIHFNTSAQPSTSSPVQKQEEKNVGVKTYSIDIADFSFQPEVLEVEAGSRITFTNKDEVEHTATAKDGSFDSGLLAKGKSYTITLSKPGEYEIYCKPHSMMKTKIVVK
jgi:plastocyanin